mgnify:CR=1 FL=1
MNAPAIANILRATSSELAVDNARQQFVEEQRFDQILLAYIDNPGKRFRSGGIVNLIYSVATALENSRLFVDAPEDVEYAVNLIQACAEGCDLPFKRGDDRRQEALDKMQHILRRIKT